jgi:hypothetical protein
VQAISLVQERNRDLLKGLSREQPDLYRQLGDCFGARRKALANRRPADAGRQRKRGSRRASKTPEAGSLEPVKDTA